MEWPSGRDSVVYAKEYEQHIPSLLSGHPAGQVHSVFQNGVNIRMGEHLFFIGTTKNGQLPFGIHLTVRKLQQLLETVDTESPVSWKSSQQQLDFGEGVPAVSLSEAAPFNWEIVRTEVSNKDLADNLALFVCLLFTEQRTTGLNVEIEPFLTSHLEETEMDGPTEQHISRLLNVMNSSDVKEIETELRYFLGRGQGLTPSGDDHLVGLLAIHTATGILSKPFVETLSRLVQNESLTTDIGKEYLRYALQGKFSSTVAELASALTRKTDIYMLKPLLSELLDVGHSSGIDTVFGMLLGLLARRRK